MKAIIVYLFCLLNFTSTAQLWTDFRSCIYECVDSFYTKNPFKHKEVRGLSLIVNRKGKLISYDIRFKDQTMALSKKEYKWLFKLLSQENYKKYESVFNSDEELKYLKKNKYNIRYIPPAGARMFHTTREDTRGSGGWSQSKTFGQNLDERGYLANEYKLSWDKNKMTKTSNGAVNNGFNPSTTRFIKEQIGDKTGIFAFGISIGSGYRTMTLIYNNTNDKSEFSLLDQKTAWSPKLKVYSAPEIESKLNGISSQGSSFYEEKYHGSFNRLDLIFYQYQKDVKQELIIPR